MEDWDEYRLILALHRAGTLRGAAATLGLTHTTVSRRLESLQKKRGCVFERKVGGYCATSLGDALIDVAEAIESLALKGQRHQTASESSISGPVRVSLPEVVAQYLLLDDLFEIANLYPNIDLKIETSYRLINLDKNEADIVVRGADQPPDHLVGRRLFPNRVTYFADRTYLEETPADQLRWIAPTSDGHWPSWLQNSPFPSVPVAVFIDDITARHRALVKGLGLGRGACFMADPEPNIARLTDDEPIPQQEFWVLTHPDLKRIPRIRVVMDHIIEAMLKKRDLVLG